MRANCQRWGGVAAAARLLLRLAMLTGAGMVAGNLCLASEIESPELLVDHEQWLNEDELAGRLAGFLWRAEPDEALRELAARRQLHRPEILRNEAARLLADSRSRDFVNAFLEHWLKLSTGRPRSSAPDRAAAASVALDRAQGFFARLLRENRNVSALLDPNQPLLRERLAVQVPDAMRESPGAGPLARSLTRSLIEYSRGAPIRESDALAVDDILARSKVDGYRLATLIHEVVQSELFQTK